MSPIDNDKSVLSQESIGNWLNRWRAITPNNDYMRHETAMCYYVFLYDSTSRVSLSVGWLTLSFWMQNINLPQHSLWVFYNFIKNDNVTAKYTTMRSNHKELISSIFASCAYIYLDEISKMIFRNGLSLSLFGLGIHLIIWYSIFTAVCYSANPIPITSVFLHMWRFCSSLNYLSASPVHGINETRNWSSLRLWML